MHVWKPGDTALGCSLLTCCSWSLSWRIALYTSSNLHLHNHSHDSARQGSPLGSMQGPPAASASHSSWSPTHSIVTHFFALFILSSSSAMSFARHSSCTKSSSNDRPTPPMLLPCANPALLTVAHLGILDCCLLRLADRWSLLCCCCLCCLLALGLLLGWQGVGAVVHMLPVSQKLLEDA